MLTLSVLTWLTLLAALAAFWWHSDGVKHRALKQANTHCDNLGLQLLDHTMVIKSLWPMRSESGALCLKRHYRFEFTSTGQERYQGSLVMAGVRMLSITLEPHIMP